MEDELLVRILLNAGQPIIGPGTTAMEVEPPGHTPYENHLSETIRAAASERVINEVTIILKIFDSILYV